MGSTRKPKKLSRRKRREIARRQQTRQTGLRLVSPMSNVPRISDEPLLLVNGSVAFELEPSPSLDNDPDASVPPSGDEPPSSERVIRSVASLVPSDEVDAKESATAEFGFVVGSDDVPDDDARILGWPRRLREPSPPRQRREPSSDVAEKRAVLIRALAAYIDAAQDEKDDFYQVAFAFEGKLLRHARSGLAEETDDRTLPNPSVLPEAGSRRAERLNRNAAWEREFLTALESILLDLAIQERRQRSRSRTKDVPQGALDLSEFGQRLWMNRFHARADDALGKFVFGKDVMRHIHSRLAQRTPSMPDVPRFMLYNVNPVSVDRMIGGPTVSGLHIWSEMRKRLLRGASHLARFLRKEYGY